MAIVATSQWRRAHVWAYLARRFAQALGVLLLAYTLTFAMVNLLPSDPLSLRFSQTIGTSAEQLAELNRYYGFDRPLHEQYVSQLLGVLRGELGYAIDNGQPVLRQLLTALPSTVSLAFTAVGLALIWSICLGLLIWNFPNARLNPLLRVLPGVAGSIPVFWTSIIIVQVASFRLGLFSAFDPTGPVAVLAAALSLAIPISASIGQSVIASIDEFDRSSFLLVVRARGASNGRIVTRYLWRTILVPVLNVVAIVFGTVMTATVVTEHVFGRTGIGSLMYRSIIEQDLPMVQGIVLLAALLFVLSSLAVDGVALLIDKRSRPWIGTYGTRVLFEKAVVR